MRAHVTGSCTSCRRLTGATSLHLRSTPAGLRRRCAAQADTPSFHLMSGVYGETATGNLLGAGVATLQVLLGGLDLTPEH